jgi:hypothetical protein
LHVGNNAAMSRGTVFVSEASDDDDTDMCTGLWSAHWQLRDQWREGPDGVSLQEAIVWGRQQADVVLVSPADSDVQYSAGVRPPQREGIFPPWPEGQELPRRRAAGMEYLDRAPDAAPILWRVRAGGTFARPGLAIFLTSYTASLRADDALEDVLLAAHPAGAGRYECEFTVLAATADEAQDAAFEATHRALETAIAQLPTRGMSALMNRLVPISRVDSYVKGPVPADSHPDAGA